MDIIKIKGNNYERYEELLIKCDELQKEAAIYMEAYIREFGDLIADNFKEKITCIEKKKEIAYCQTLLNRGETINQAEFKDYMKEQMSEYYAELDKMLKYNAECNQAEVSTEYIVSKVKHMYRKLAKMLHPDINPLTSDSDTLMELWNRVVFAYGRNALEDMMELEVLIVKALEQAGWGVIDIDVPNIEEKIQEIERRIDEIVNTDPYQYKFLLADTNMVEEKNEALRSELKEYRDYKEQLEIILDEILMQGKFVIRMNVE